MPPFDVNDSPLHALKPGHTISFEDFRRDVIWIYRRDWRRRLHIKVVTRIEMMEQKYA